MNKNQTLSVTKIIPIEASGVRLDRCLRLWIPKLAQSLIEKAARKGLLKLDGKKVKPSHLVNEGQSISFPEIFLSLASNIPAAPSVGLTRKDRSWLKSLILYEDNDIVVLNKPPGIAVQKGTGITKSLDTMMKSYETAYMARLVHRLDRETSGILVFAKSLPMARWLTQAFRERKVQKTYWALVYGVPEVSQGVISLSLSKKPTAEKMQVDQDKGLAAMTCFRVLETSKNNVTWLELTPTTGRTHQLRVHCWEGLKTPILGDRKYGGREAIPFGRTDLYLHARSLVIPLPQGNTLTFEAAPPKNFIEELKKHSLNNKN